MNEVPDLEKDLKVNEISLELYENCICELNIIQCCIARWSNTKGQEIEIARWLLKSNLYFENSSTDKNQMENITNRLASLIMSRLIVKPGRNL